MSISFVALIFQTVLDFILLLGWAGALAINTAQ
jgi:hypothetical protein